MVRHPHRVGDRRGSEAVGSRNLTLGKRDCQSGSSIGLGLDGLVDGHALSAEQHALQALIGGILARHGDLASNTIALEHGDCRTAETIIG